MAYYNNNNNNNNDNNVINNGVSKANNALYMGELMDNKRDGQGICRWEDGNVYDGEWRDDKRHGRGKFLIGETGDEYVGEWKQGKADGYGVMSWVMGTRYEGMWKENRRNGYGTFHYLDGVVYRGEWVENKRHGKGTLHFPDGSLFMGTFVNDVVAAGEGRFHSASFAVNRAFPECKPEDIPALVASEIKAKLRELQAQPVLGAASSSSSSHQQQLQQSSNSGVGGSPRVSGVVHVNKGTVQQPPRTAVASMPPSPGRVTGSIKVGGGGGGGGGNNSNSARAMANNAASRGSVLGLGLSPSGHNQQGPTPSSSSSSAIFHTDSPQPQQQGRMSQQQAASSSSSSSSSRQQQQQPQRQQMQSRRKAPGFAHLKEVGLERHLLRDLLAKTLGESSEINRYLATLHPKGLDNLLSLKLRITSMDELKQAGIHRVIHARKFWNALQDVDASTLLLPPSSHPQLHHFLFTLFEFWSLDDPLLLTMVRLFTDRLGLTLHEELTLLSERDIRRLPLLDGHRIALLHVREEMLQQEKERLQAKKRQQQQEQELQRLQQQQQRRAAAASQAQQATPPPPPPPPSSSTSKPAPFVLQQQQQQQQRQQQQQQVPSPQLPRQQPQPQPQPQQQQQRTGYQPVIAPRRHSRGPIPEPMLPVESPKSPNPVAPSAYGKGMERFQYLVGGRGR